MNVTNFYRAFEERHRGPREEIAKRLEVYLPFVAPLLELYQPADAVDLGCGRGEWLELMARKGFVAHGVDLDDGMLQACRERELAATREDALTYLKSLADESQCVVSGFHIAEHLEFEALQDLAAEALRVLKPGGLLILETPNPENLVVGTNTFWLDPTHHKPLPPPLLAFLAEHLGFARVKLLRLQEPADLGARSDVRLADVITGASPDYSIAAQKGAESELLSRFDAAFASAYGIDLVTLADRFDHRTASGLADLEQQVAHAQQHAAAASEALVRINADLQERLAAATAESARAQKEVAVALSRADDVGRQVDALRAEAEALRPERDRLTDERSDLLWERDALHAEAEALRLERDRLTNERNGLQAQRDALHAEGEALRPEHGRLTGERNGLLAERDMLRLELNALRVERDALRESWSWRVTAPLRWGVGLMLGSRPRVLAQSADQRGLIRMPAAMLLARPARAILGWPWARRLANRMYARLPGIQPFARQLVISAQVSHDASALAAQGISLLQDAAFEPDFSPAQGAGINAHQFGPLESYLRGVRSHRL